MQHLKEQIMDRKSSKLAIDELGELGLVFDELGELGFRCCLLYTSDAADE